MLIQYGWLFAFHSGRAEHVIQQLRNLQLSSQVDAWDAEGGPEKEALAWVSSILETCQNVESLQQLLPDLTRFQNEVRIASSRVRITILLEALRWRVLDELSRLKFLAVDSSDVPLYEADEPFGDVVSKALPHAIEDISEAAKCLALGRNTACVFHLMRVMETAVGRIGKRFGVHIIDPRKESWHNIMTPVEKAVDAMPLTPSRALVKHRRWKGVCGALHAVRVAWRNDVMHPKQSYSREEAAELYSRVRSFAAELADVL